MSNEKKGSFHSRKIKLSLLKSRIPLSVYETLERILDNDDFTEFDRQIHLIKEHYNKNTDELLIDNNDDIEDRDKWTIHTLLEENQNLVKDREWISERASQTDKENRKLLSAYEGTKLELHRARNQIELNEKNEKKKDDEIKKLNSQIEELRGKVQQNRIDEKIPGYVDGVKEKLDKDDDYFIKMSNRWAIAGSIAAVGAIISAFVTFFININFEGLSTPELIYIFTRGLLGIALLSWLSYICFSNSKKYTHESIRRKDCQHALMFGKIFLQIYGSTASKEDAINVFKDWNMSGDSAFSDQTEQPPGFQSIIASVKEKISPKEADKD